MKKLSIVTLYIIVFVLIILGIFRIHNHTRYFQQECILMDSFFKIEAKSTTDISPILDEIFAHLKHLENILDSHSDTGFVFKINHLPQNDTISVPDELFEIIKFSLTGENLSSIKYSVFSGSLVELWGIGEKNIVPDSSEIASVLSHCSSSGFLLIEDGKKLVRLDSSTDIDLGSIGKGYAVDYAYNRLLKANIPYFLINAGGTIRGHSDSPFKIGIRHPRQPDSLWGIINLPSDMAISTSGDYIRYFEKDGIRYHHIFDLATGYPARPAVSTSVIAETATRADMLSTLIFVTGEPPDEEILYNIIYKENGELKSRGNIDYERP